MERKAKAKINTKTSIKIRKENGWRRVDCFS
jgi:hypothetical protein